MCSTDSSSKTVYNSLRHLAERPWLGIQVCAPFSTHITSVVSPDLMSRPGVLP